ncbi:hypothetical protein ABZP36_029405 [Zizania latifolia]
MLVEVDPKADESINGALPARHRHDQIEHLAHAADIIHQPKHPNEEKESNRLLRNSLRPDPLAPLPVDRDSSGLLACLRRGGRAVRRGGGGTTPGLGWGRRRG